MSILTRTSPTRRERAGEARAAAAPAGAFARESIFPRAPLLDDATALREAPRIYCGPSVDELIPRIVAELGPDAIVLRHERGLTGGFAGFFRRPFVEIEAERGAPRFDRYDEDGALALPGAFDEASNAPAPGAFDAYGDAHEPRTAFAGSDTAPGPEAFEEGAPSPPGDAFAAELASAEAAVPVVVENLHAGTAAPCEEPCPEDQCELPALAPSSVAPAASAPIAVSSGPARDAIERALLEAGVDERLVREALEAATAHVLPLIETVSPPALAVAVRRALAQRIPVCPPLPSGGATIAFVGPGGSGKSACCAALLDAYHRRSTLPAACATLVCESPHPAGGQLDVGRPPRSAPLDVVFPPHLPGPIPIDDPLAAQALGRAREEGLLLLDTPSLSPVDERSIGALAAALSRLSPDRVVLALPATLGAKPAARLLEAYRPLGTSALAVTHVDETDQLGVAVQVACTLGIAPTYLLEGGSSGFGLTQVEPADLADRLLPPR